MKQHIARSVGLACLAASAVPSSVLGEETASLFGDSLSGDVSVGWDTKYFFRGLYFGDDVAYSNVGIEFALTDRLSLASNFFYADVTDEGLAYTETNFGISLSYDTGYGAIDFGMTYFKFFDGFGGRAAGAARLTGAGGNGDATELFLTYSKDIFESDYCTVGAYVTALHDFRIEGTYAEFGLGASGPIAGCVSYEFSAAIGYSVDDYYTTAIDPMQGEDSGFTHVILSAGIPIQITESLVLTPHIAANIAMEARDIIDENLGQDDTEVFYGVAVAASF